MKTERPVALAAVFAGLMALLPMLLLGEPETVATAPLVSASAAKAAPLVAAAPDKTTASAPASPPAPTEAPPRADDDDDDDAEKGPRNAALRAAAKDPAIVALGKENYVNFCQACHGAEGNNIDSPSNLFDAKWLHGGRPAEIEWTVLKGVLEKGMPGWGEILAPEDTTALTAYLLTFQK